MEETNESIVKRIQAGEKLYMQLWENVQRLVFRFASRYFQGFQNTQNSAALEDLIQSGFIAMIEAAAAYDAEKNTQFSTVLIPYLKHEFSVAIGYRTPAQIGLMKMGVGSLQEPVAGYEEDSISIQDTIANAGDTETESGDILRVEDRIYDKQVSDLLQDILSGMEPEERTTIEKRYFEGMTISEAAAQIGVDRYTLRKIENNALKKFRYDSRLKCMRYIEQHNVYAGTGFVSFNYTGSSQPERIALRLEDWKG